MKLEKIANNKIITAEIREKERNFLIHTHSFFEIEFVLSGNGECVINDIAYPIKRGSLMFLTPADCHVIKINEKMRYWNISFSGNLLSEEILKRTRHKDGFKSFFEEDELLKLEQCSQLILNEINSTGNVRYLLDYMLSLFLPEKTDGKEGPLTKVIDFVKMNFRESPTISDAAKIACLSPAYFGNLFKSTYGVNFSTYVNRKKVECAKTLLANDMNVTETCFEAGFNSLSSFLKVFRKETGLTPKEYQMKERVGYKTFK